jgi:hypothetical protein
MKKQLYRVAAATILGLSLTTGVVAADTGGIDTTGPRSNNNIHRRFNRDTRVDNNNDVRVNNDNNQDARTGRAVVTDNNWGGDAYTGDAANRNDTFASVSVDNGPSSVAALDRGGFGGGGLDGGFGGFIEDTGPRSNNRIDTNVNDSVRVNNDNNIVVDNNNRQNARSGDAIVSDNTHGGSAVSGDASNRNSSTFEIDVRN